VLVFVCLSWLLVLGSAIAAAVHTEGVKINATEFCTKTKTERNVADAVSTITRFFHDTLVFIVTSWWLYQSNATGDRSGFANVVFGKHLFPFTRSLFNDGQAYYLSVFSLPIHIPRCIYCFCSATLILNVVVIALPLMSKPFVTPCTLGSPLLVLINNMASHVYRNLISAKYRDHYEFLHWIDGEWHEDSVGTELGIRQGENAVRRGRLGGRE
jgi:hypothetical protein